MKNNLYSLVKKLRMSGFLLGASLVYSVFNPAYSQITVLSGTPVKINPATVMSSSMNLVVKSGGTINVQGTLILKKDLLNQNLAANSVGTGTVVFSGSTIQSINGQNEFQNLTINNPAGVINGGKNIVNGVLTLSNGLVTLGANNLLLGSGASIAGTPSAAAMLVPTGTGEVRKSYSGVGTFTFPVGDQDALAEYSPVTLNFTVGTFSNAYAGVNLVNSAYSGSSGSYLQRYWNVTSSGITAFACNAAFNYVPADVVGTESAIYCFRVSPTVDQFDAANTTLHQLTASALTSFGIFSGNQHMVCQQYAFATGWNSISSYINPFDPIVENLFAPIVNNVIILRNLTGVYWPGENVNTIGNFINASGYALKVTEEVDFEICGAEYASKELTLTPGWHYLPVLSDCPVNAMELFGPHLNEIVIVTDLIGTKVFWPAMEIFSLETLEPGKAYKMKITNGFTVTFPECNSRETIPAFSTVNTIHSIWGDVKTTPSTEVVAFRPSATDAFIVGDVIGVFGQNSQLYGYMEVTDAGIAQAITLFGDDVTSIDQDGFTDGETVSYKLYRGVTREMFDLNVEYDNAMDNVSGNFYSGSFAAIKDIIMGITGIGTVSGGNIVMYPNPANDMVYINLSNVDNTEASVVVFDTEGRQVINQVINGQAELNVSSLEAGIYFVKINTNTLSEIKKLVIK